MTTLPIGLSIEDWLGGLSISIDGDKAGSEEQQFTIGLDVRDADETWRLILSNGVLTYRRQAIESQARKHMNDLDLSLSRVELHQILTGKKATTGVHALSGDMDALNKLLSFAGIGGQKSSR